MKVLRFLALAGMLTMVFPLAAMASAKAPKPEKKKIAVIDHIQVAGKTLQPGQYQVEWRGSGPTVNVKFLKHGKTILTAPAQLAQLKTPAPYDAVVENTSKNGAKTMHEIEWNHQREALRFVSQSHTSQTHQTSKRAS
jgi:hypothetical protein